MTHKRLNSICTSEQFSGNKIIYITFNCDNRVQQRVGATTAHAPGYIDYEVAMGIPVSINGKSIFYDRKTPPENC